MTSAFIETLKMIKIEHSIFALPFALVSAFIAASGLPEPKVFVLIVIAMVLARSSAMAFNRYIDAEIDARNPRTAVRSIPAGRLTRAYALVFTLVSAGLFILTAAMMNRLALLLSPLVLIILLGYSLTKRFTSYCHFVLGLALGLSPFGAWVAVTGGVDKIPIILGVAVLCWVAGFDIIYACQDIDFDRDERLHSVPVRLGIGRSLILSRVLHLAMIGIIVWLGLYLHFGAVYWAGVVMVAACLIYEHALVWGGNMERVDMAFLTMNGVVSLIYGVTTIAGIL